jgi:alpha-beta hydrolase superfamily lysophospholipase
MKFPLAAVLASLLLSCAASPPSRKPSSGELAQSHVFLTKVRIGSLPYEQRVGLFVEAEGETFKGCVLYLQGLGDSIRNHYPLFNALTNAGYRVLAFDYLGQGGSEGNMAATRIEARGDPFPKPRKYEIGYQAKWLWEKFSAEADPLYGRTCAGSKKMVIGWSTGGLAAYRLAYEKWADAVALIAPGIIPNLCVGEAGNGSLPKCLEKNLTLDHVITVRTLTTATYGTAADPHLDPVKPSAFRGIKQFTMNLISTAYLHARNWRIDPEVKGIVFLSGKQDSYVDRDWTRSVLQENAPQFQVIAYDGALHEIDNEMPRIADDLHEKTVRFFDSALAGR